jgi:hypothetical protein
MILMSCSLLKLNLELKSVSRPVCLDVGLPSGTHNQTFFFVWQFWLCWYWAPSLTRGWVCNLLVQLLFGLARAITLGSKYRRTQTIFYSFVWDFPNLEGQVAVFISHRSRVAHLYPRHWVPFSLLLATRWSYSNPPSHRMFFVYNSIF